MNRPNNTIEAASAPTGIAKASTAEASRPDPEATDSDLSDHALDQVVHRLEHRLRLLVSLAGGDHFLAGVVLQRALEDDEVALHHFGLHRIGLGLARRRGRLAIGRHLHVAVL